MPSPVEVAVDAYIQLWRERDPAARAALIEACFAANGRIVSRGSGIRGRAELAEAAASFLADPQFRGFRISSPIDASGSSFRFYVSIERADGTTFETFDAGEIDADGKIALILTFTGRLGQATP